MTARRGARAAPLLALLLCSGCFRLLPSRGGGETRFEPPRRIEPADVALPAGYRIEPVAQGLTFPTSVAFDGEGGVYVTEAGYSYGEVVLEPKLLRVEPDGRTTLVASGRNPPWNGATFADGAFYIGGGHLAHGQILRVTRDGRVSVLVDSLPSLGDHHTNGPVLGPDGWLYWGQGTATNAGVVGPDNYDYGWLQRYPRFHDVPCADVTLAGRNFTTANPLTPEDDRATTGAFVPFGVATTAGQVIRGRPRCGGAVLRVRPTGGEPEVVAWGLRNPFALAFSPDGALYATENQYDVRGSRPVFGAGDLLWRVQPGVWYGWPDFYAGRALNQEWFDPPGGRPRPELLLARHPNAPPRPAALLGVHSASSGIDFSRGPAFGHAGQAFVAQFGDLAPTVGKVVSPVGFKVVRVDVASGVIHDFAVNRGSTNGPASRLGGGGLERPLGLRFDPTGAALYVVDFGVMTTVDGQPRPRPGTGVLWRISRAPGTAPGAAPEDTP